MPGYDSTGPNGTGPNGRGLGPCGDGTPRYGRGFFGFRRGRRGGGRRGFWFAPATRVDEKEALQAEKGWLQRQLDTVSARLNEIDKE
jgi:hypothetical protein